MNDPVTVAGLFMVGLGILAIAITTYMQKDKTGHSHH